MASRALARVARSAGRLRARLRPHPDAGEAAGDPALARRHVRPGARRLLGQRRDVDARDGRRRSASSPRNAGKVDGIKISLLDKDKEIAMRRRLPAGVRMYTGDDFNYAELIAGDGVGSGRPWPQRRAARHLRRDRAGGERRAGGARRTATSTRFHAILGADGAAVAPHLRRRRRASTRPASSSWPGSTATRRTSRWSAASRARARCRTSPSCSAWPTRPACCEQPELAVRAHEDAAGAARRRR